MKLGVIGTGSMGRNHVRIYSELKEVEEVYAFDVDTEKLKKSDVYDLIVCNTMEELLARVTKSMPKEMLLIIDKPIIQFVVEEAIISRIGDNNREHQGDRSKDKDKDFISD